MWCRLPQVLVLALLLGACASSRPLEEFTLARTAVDSARKVGAPHFSPAFWYKAQRHYRKGMGYFKGGTYRRARSHFIEARKYAEKAENKTRIDKFQFGEPLP